VIALEEARKRVLAAVAPLPAERRSLTACDGLVTDRDVVAAVAVPAFDNSAMDGYAVRAADIHATPVTLPVVTTSAAGHPAPRGICAGEAARILTGAVMVSGADAVVPIEDTDAGTTAVEVRKAVPTGANVRRAGEDVQAGDVVVGAGTRLGPAQLGVLASVGVARVSVHRPPAIAVVSTGDELVEPGAQLRPGQVFESNRTVLEALVRRACPHARVGTASTRDDPASVANLFERLGAEYDVILSTGGVSMGAEYDTVRAVLETAGEVDFWQVAIRPAKPLAFGRVGRSLFFGLPGNPVSAVVSYGLFALPVLRTLSGLPGDGWPPETRVPAGEPLRRSDDAKVHFLRVRFGPDGRVYSSGPQGSHVMTGLAAADALAVMPPECLEVGRDDEVEVVLLSEWGL
jgi:molybdopterin molybdotransferase